MYCRKTLTIQHTAICGTFARQGSQRVISFRDRPVGSSRRVERPSVVMSEAAQRPSVAREARKNFATYFYGGKEAALAASRYIEGHALKSRKKISIQAEIKHTASS